MFELVVLAALFAAVGFLRPRWSSLLAACVPGAVACAWLFVNEDVPGEETGVVDVVWFAAMGAVVGVASALACAVGVVSRRAVRRR